MMPDLGKYAISVFSAYAVTLGFLCVLILGSLWQARRARRLLTEAERQDDA